MSKEASSWSGTILGSSDYWEKLNHDTLFSDVTTRRPDYRMALTRLGHRANNAIDAIYNDLNELAGKIRFLPSEDRNALAKQVQSLYDVCKMGAEYYLRPKGYDVAALLLEHSLESSPSKLYFTQTHWVTQKVMESEAFSRGFSAVKELIRKNSSSYDNTGTFTVNFQETNETDLYYGIGKAEIKYACVRSPSKVYVAFVLEDTYDFDNFRVVYGDEGHYIILNIDPGPLANDAGLLSQANGVINTYDIHIRFSKTIDLEG